MKQKGERRKHYEDRMNILIGRVKAAGFTDEDIKEIQDYRALTSFSVAVLKSLRSRAQQHGGGQ